MNNMSTFQENCFKSIEIIKKNNMKPVDGKKYSILSKLMLKF